MPMRPLSSKYLKTQNTREHDPMRAAEREMEFSQNLKNIGATGKLGEATAKRLSDATFDFVKKALERRQGAAMRAARKR